MSYVFGYLTDGNMNITSVMCYRQSPKTLCGILADAPGILLVTPVRVCSKTSDKYFNLCILSLITTTWVYYR